MLGNIDEFVKIDVTAESTKKLVNKIFNFNIIVKFYEAMDSVCQLCLIAVARLILRSLILEVFCKAYPITSTLDILRNMFHEQQDIFLSQPILIIKIKTLKSDHHFLLLRTHEKFEEKLNKFIMINPFVTVRINLTNYSLRQQLRQIQI